MSGSLFDKRFVIVAGKGGVGKSTLSSAIALAGARMGKRVLICELANKEKAAALFGHPEPVGYTPTRVHHNIDVINVTAAQALHEYGLMKLRFERVYRAVFENPIMKSLTRMIPGMNELTLLGKAWHLERELDGRGRPRWDMLVVDAPATGHGISLLVLPHVITETVKVGPLYEETRLIRDMLTDPKRTCMNIVTLPEEMPVNETLELRARMDDMLRIEPGRLFVNAIWPEAPSEAELAILNQTHLRLEGKGDERMLGVLRTSRFMVRRRRAQERHLEALRTRCDMPRTEIPYVFTDSFGFDAIDAISRLISPSAQA